MGLAERTFICRGCLKNKNKVYLIDICMQVEAFEKGFVARKTIYIIYIYIETKQSQA
jgi:hypothetical protein